MVGSSKIEINKPRRILALGAPDSGVLNILQELTGSSPALVDDSTAGLSHLWDLETNYYKATVPIWIDEILDLDVWEDEFLKSEAEEVVSVVGAWVYCFRKPLKQEDLVNFFSRIISTMNAISKIIEKGVGHSWDGSCLAIATRQPKTPVLDQSYDDWDDLCREHGFEFIDSEAKGPNSLGDLTGVARLREALEVTDWNADADSDILSSDDENNLNIDELEASMRLLGVSSEEMMRDGSLSVDAEQDEEQQVEELEAMMIKLQATKDTISAMPEEERKKFASKAVNDIMKTF